MTAVELLERLQGQGLAVSSWRGGAGRFRDLEVAGASFEELVWAAEELRAAGVACCVTTCSNPEHQDYGKPYLLIPSFWWELG